MDQHPDRDPRRRLEAIQNAEEEERRKRAKNLAARHRADVIRKRQKERLQAWIRLIAVGAVVILALIGAVLIVRKIVSHKALPDDSAAEALAAENAYLAEVKATGAVLYDPASAVIPKGAGRLLETLTLAASPDVTAVSDYADLVSAYRFFASSYAYASVREAVKNAPLYGNGYVWSENASMRSTVTGSYLYDTNAAYLSAVSRVCLAEGSTAFLNETDGDGQPKHDISNGMTVMQKLEAAAGYFFDGDVSEGGAKYDEQTGLLTIYTEENSGTPSGKPSNRLYAFRFGHLDAYANVRFNMAMRDLAALFAFMDLPERAAQYEAVADANAAAINETFWNPATGRYIGCIDRNGVFYDRGFTALNLEAVAAGIADAAKAKSILSWIDGTRIVEGDGVKGKAIVVNGLPRAVTADSGDKWSGYLADSAENSAKYAYLANGGSYEAAYAAVEAFLAVNDEAGAYAFAQAFASGSVPETVGEAAAAALAPTAFLKVCFGLDTDGRYLIFRPAFLTFADELFGKSLPDYGLQGVTFGGTAYRFLAGNGAVYVLADNERPVRLRIGGFEAGKTCDVTVSSDVSTGEAAAYTASEDGTLEIVADFGETRYLKITPSDKEPETEKPESIQ